MPTASQVIADPDFYEKVRLREQVAIAFHEEHAKDVWRGAVEVRPIKGPYQIGQLVYVFRKRARGLLSTRHGVWIGPGRVVGLESLVVQCRELFGCHSTVICTDALQFRRTKQSSGISPDRCLRVVCIQPLNRPNKAFLLKLMS